jgi:HEXXH motif-containing protein
MEESVLDLEESIVHEAGHQILYRLGELTSLTRPGTPVEGNYVLPWSGSQRDLFGYLHAYYIYALLVKYYWRRGKRADRYALDSRLRAMIILQGSLTATTELIKDENLSDQGRLIVEELARELDQLKSEIQAEFGSRKGKRDGQSKPRA